jgi:hypothetical protein
MPPRDDEGGDDYLATPTGSAPNAEESVESEPASPDLVTANGARHERY